MKKCLSCFLLFIVSILPVTAQEQADSLAAAHDSLVRVLQSQVQELELKRIYMETELERVGRNARRDSLYRLQQRQRIDSLRQITQGAPLVIEGDTLLVLYARKGGMLAEARVQEAEKKIEALGHRMAFAVDSVYVYEGELFSDIMSGDEVILSVTDQDALWEHKQRAVLAEEYATVIENKIRELHDDYGLQMRLWRILLALVVIVVQVCLIVLTNKLYRRYKFCVTRSIYGKLKPISIRGYEFLDRHRQGIAVISVFNFSRFAVIVLQLFVTLPLLFSIFPETEKMTITVLGYIWNPFKDLLLSFVAYLPNLFKIGVIFFCFRYIVKGVKFLANEIENDHLKLNGFYADWAAPTYYILRALLYSLMFVMIWPLLPNSNSEIFQGVSVFIGIIVSLGSTSIIGNIMAGMVLTYMRPFRIGDYIKVGDTVGEVIEKTVLVTRIRTRKNEIVTIQNSSLLGSQTSNYTEAAKSYGLIVHTKVTIGYDVPWQLIKQVMEQAAADTSGIEKDPKPFMQTTALDDFYVEYEINAFTTDSERLPRIYSELHQNLLKRFFEAGIEIMSPHIYARRDGIDIQMPSEFVKG